MKAIRQNKETKNVFDYLNDVKMDFSDYEIMNLTELERNTMKNVNKPHKKFTVGKLSVLLWLSLSVKPQLQKTFSAILFPAFPPVTISFLKLTTATEK